MRLRDALAAVGLAALPGVTAAQTIDRSNGAASAPILQLTTVPRAAALGGALTAASGVTSIFANPAGAATVVHVEAQLAGRPCSKARRPARCRSGCGSGRWASRPAS